MDWQPQLDSITQAARAGGDATLPFFDTNFSEKNKAHGDVCTDADLAAEKAILEILTKHFPDYNIIAEESGTKDKKSEFTLVIDPLDGTANFRISSPMYATSIALMHGDQTVVGAIYTPKLGDLYTATKNGGAFKNGQPIQVASAVKTFNQAIISYGQGWPVEGHPGLDFYRAFYDGGGYRITNNWAPALDLCFLAAGKIHGIIVNRNDLYDVAAGRLIATEAGARIGYLPNSRTAGDRELLWVMGCSTAITELLQKHCADFV